MPITPLRSCHDTAIPQLQLLPSPCVWLGPQWCQCGALSPLWPHSHLKGNTEARPSQEPLPPQPFHTGAGWRLQRRGKSSYWQCMKLSSCHMTVLPAAVTFLQQLNASPGSARPRPRTWAHATPQTPPANSNTCLSLCKESYTESKTLPSKRTSSFLEGKTTWTALEQATRLLHLKHCLQARLYSASLLLIGYRNIMTFSNISYPTLPDIKWLQWNLVISNERAIWEPHHHWAPGLHPSPLMKKILKDLSSHLTAAQACALNVQNSTRCWSKLVKKPENLTRLRLLRLRLHRYNQVKIESVVF